MQAAARQRATAAVQEQNRYATAARAAAEQQWRLQERASAARDLQTEVCDTVHRRVTASPLRMRLLQGCQEADLRAHGCSMIAPPQAEMPRPVLVTLIKSSPAAGCLLELRGRERQVGGAGAPGAWPQRRGRAGTPGGERRLLHMGRLSGSGACEPESRQCCISSLRHLASRLAPSRARVRRPIESPAFG